MLVVCNFSHVCRCEPGPARNRELQYYHFIHGHNDSGAWMLDGASRARLVAELALVRLGRTCCEPGIQARSATRPSLAPDSLAQICCNLCTAVVGPTCSTIVCSAKVSLQIRWSQVSDKANLVIKRWCKN